MFPNHNRRTIRFASRRAGLTLVELLSAIAILAVMALAMGTLAVTVQQGSDYSSGRLDAAQHARVVIERMQRTLQGAHASEQFPGLLVVPYAFSGFTFPDAIVVWSPQGEPANPDGLPLWSEVVVYCGDDNSPNRLLEIVDRSASRTVPALDDTSGWQSELDYLKTSPMSKRVVLTDLMRTCKLDLANSSGSAVRAGLRFEVRHTPSDEDWNQYKAGVTAWEDLPWVQDVHGSRTGLRQSWCAFEIQLMPGADAIIADPSGVSAIPFLGSGALYYELHR
jgi:prepilin-type N-terminal cleavage/methylation domain-containing protein